MGIDYWLVLIATVAEFFLGAIWYMPLFGKIWGKIHGHDKLSKKEQKEAQKGMGPLLGVQLIITFVTTLVLAKVHVLLPDYSLYTLTAGAWIGFVVPTQIASIIFGGTDKKWFVQKALIMSVGSFLCLLAAAAILN